MLLEAQGDLRREMLAFDRVQSELIRQVHMHCAERGMLLERCRVQHHDWVVRLMLAVQDLKISREKALRAEREDRQIQEARLTEQLNVNRNLKERLSTVTREMEWHHKADMAKSRGEQGKEVERFDGLKAFKSMKNMMAFVKGSYEQDEADRLEAEREAERRVNELYQVLVDELRPDQLNHLVARIMRRLDPDGQLEIVQTVLDALRPEVQVAITADVFASFDQSMMEDMIVEMGEHNDGADAVQLFRQVLHDDGSLNSVEGQKTLAHHFEAASPQARTEYLELLEELLTEKERRTLVEKLGAHIPVAKDAHGDSNDETTGGSDKELMRRQSSKRISLRHAKKANESNKLSLSSSQPLAEPSPGTQDANDPFSVPVPEGNADEAPRIGRETPSTLSHLLQKRPPKPPKQMQTGELLRFISAAICHRYKEEGAPGSMASAEFSAQRRKAGGKAPLFGDTLWEYICVAEDARAAALQQLANLNLTLSLEAAACEQNPAVSKFRIKAFRALCGLHPPPGGQWAAVQADFYLFATHELLTVTTHGQTLGHLQRTLSQELLYIELPKAIAALRNLVSDSKLLTDLTTQVMEMAAEEVEAGRHSSPAVSLDWILDHLMMAWSDTNKKSEDQLQALFEKADDNGDGAPIHAFIRARNPCTKSALGCRCAFPVRVPSNAADDSRHGGRAAGTPWAPQPPCLVRLCSRRACWASRWQTTTQQDFAIYNECIAASEAALGARSSRWRPPRVSA